jgi:putative transposase
VNGELVRACGTTSLLAQHGIQISMSRKATPYDNARTESFMKTLKYEEVYRQEYRDLPDAFRSLRRFLEKVYNEKRLHSALGYLPPTEFEANLMMTNNCTEVASRQLSL